MFTVKDQEGGIFAASFSFCVEITGSSVTQGAACSSSLLKLAPKPSLQFCYLPLLGGTLSSLDLKPKCADDMMYVDFSIRGWVVPYFKMRINQKNATSVEFISKIKRKY